VADKSQINIRFYAMNAKVRITVAADLRLQHAIALLLSNTEEHGQ